MKPIFTSLLSCMFAFGSCSAAAQLPDFGNGLENGSPSRVLNNQQGLNDHWKAIGRLESEGGRACTATLIDTRSADSAAAAPAYVLTSGHCLYRKNYGAILADTPVTGTVTFNYFADSVEQQQAYPLKRVSWSSMQGVDLAIVELDASLQSLIVAGIVPIEIAEKTPDAGADILVVGAPLPFDAPYLRMAACVQQTSGELIEQPWVWRHTVKNQCQNIEAGSSGSPLLTRDSNQLFAVLNTTTLAATAESELPEPKSGPPGASGNFGNPVSYLRRCFVAGELSNNPEVCPLFPVFSVEFPVTGQPPHYTKIKQDAEGSEIYPHWDVAFLIDKPFYRYKHVQQAIECENPDHFSHSIEAKGARIDAQISPQIGTHMLCILGVDSAQERPSPGLMRNVLTLATELQPAGPASPPEVQISQRFGTYAITWNHDHRQINHQTFKLGPAHATDCSDPAGYRGVRRKINVPPRLLPVKVCSIAYDHADQPSTVREDLLVRTEPAQTTTRGTGTRILRIENESGL